MEIRFKDGESVDDFSMRITGITNSITTLDGSISETQIVKKMLQVVPDHLEQVAISIETLLDVNDLTVEEVTGRLHNIEQRKKNTASAVDKEDRLLLTEKEWLARLKLHDNTGESNEPSNRKGGMKPWKSHKESTDGRPIQCSNCGKRGHLSKNCWSKLRNKEKAEKAHEAQSEEDELALFMVSASVLSNIPSFDSKSTEVEVIDDDVTAPLVSAKGTSWGANSTDGGVSVRSDRREGRAT